MLPRAMESTKKLLRANSWDYLPPRLKNKTLRLLAFQILIQAALKWCAFCMANFETVLSWRFSDILIPSIPKDQWKWNPKILEIFGICHWYPFLLNFSTFWPARMTIELFKGDVSGGEAGTGFPRMVLLFLSGTIITSNGHILDRHFRKKKKIKKAIANFDSTQLESCTS